MPRLPAIEARDIIHFCLFPIFLPAPVILTLSLARPGLILKRTSMLHVMEETVKRVTITCCHPLWPLFLAGACELLLLAVFEKIWSKRFLALRRC